MAGEREVCPTPSRGRTQARPRQLLLVSAPDGRGLAFLLISCSGAMSRQIEGNVVNGQLVPLPAPGARPTDKAPPGLQGTLHIVNRNESSATLSRSRFILARVSLNVPGCSFSTKVMTQP